MRTKITNLVLLVALAVIGYLVWENVLRNLIMGSGASHSDVIVYVSNNCGQRCDRMIEAIDNEGIPLISLNVDDDHEVALELREKLDRAGFRPQIYRLPVVDVYGEIMADNPSIKKVKARLKDN